MILSKESDEFGTPDDLFEALDDEFIFTIDAAATKENTKLPRFWTKEDNALRQSWAGERVFCNPPYSRGHVEAFFKKALYETTTGDCKLAVLLLPTYTERSWFHDHRRLFTERFVRRRIQFEGGASSARGNHMLVIFRSHKWTKYT